jgi:hypothetical protein
MPDADEIREEAEAAEENQETVLIRVVEWMEWLPTEPAPTEQKSLFPMTNGLTSVETLATERLVELKVSSSQQNYSFEDEEGAHVYTLYAFQAVLAQNASPHLASSLRYAQFMPMREELERDRERKEQEGRDRRDDLVVVEHVKPNREERRGNKSRKRRGR